jgi:hypothetical protein
MAILFIFADGVGVGAPDPTSNPILHAHMPVMRRWMGGLALTSDSTPLLGAQCAVVGLDATLGVAGLPQSGTGQTALLTGVNAVRLLGRHSGPYPDSRLRSLLAERSLFATLTRAGLNVAFANAFPDGFLSRARRGTVRASAVTRAALLAGLRLRDAQDLRSGRATSALLTNEAWRTHLGYEDIPEVSLEEAGRRLAALAAEHDFTLLEYYQTDMAGHAADMPQAVAVLERLDRFLAGVLSELPGRMALVLASDHGNLEDASTSHHTRSPAVLVVHGPQARQVTADMVDLTHVVALVERLVDLPTRRTVIHSLQAS